MSSNVDEYLWNNFDFLAGGGDPDGGTNVTAGDWVMMPKRELVDSTKNLTSSEKTQPNLKNAKLWLQSANINECDMELFRNLF